MRQITVVLFIVAILTLQTSATTLTYTSYRNLSQTYSDLSTLASTYPSLTDVRSIGNSIQGQQIRVLKISQNPSVDDASKGDVVFVALHHAREWITVETALYVADELLGRYATDPQLQADMNALQIWIIPVLNPDGYDHTLTDRLWRKNRRNNGDGTYGVDLNRNWGYQWGLSSGSSGTTSDETYRGTAPFSEPETDRMRAFIQGLDNLKCLVTFHSYSELYLRPWSYTTADPPGESTLKSIAQRNINRIAGVHGHVYSENIWYTCSGETTDYLWGQMRVAAFTPELRPTAYGAGGFAPPASEILPCAQENYAGCVALIHDAALPGLYIRDHNTDDGSEPSAVWTTSGWSKAFWVSPDIWTVPAQLIQGATVQLKVRVNNKHAAAQSNATVEVYYTDPRISLEFPNPDAVLIASQTVTIPAAGSVITVPWTVPTGTNIWGEPHWCVGALVKQEGDMPLTTQVQRTSNIGCRNFETTTVTGTASLTVAAQNFLTVAAELKYSLDQKLIGPGWEVTLPKSPIKRFGAVTPASLQKAKLLKATGIILEPGQSVLLPINVKVGQTVSAGSELTIHINGALVPLVPGKRQPVGNGYTYKVVAGTP